jgi:hypothetical protein
VYGCAIDLQFVIESLIHDNLIYLHEAEVDGIGILLDGCGTTTVHHNVFHAFQSSCNGIVLTGGSQYCDVSNNILVGARASDNPRHNFDTGIWLQPGCQLNTVFENLFYEPCRLWEVFDEATNGTLVNHVRNTSPARVVVTN